MKRIVLIVCVLVGIIGSASAQRDDLYFVPKKKSKAVNVDDNKDSEVMTSTSAKESAKTLTVTEVSASQLVMDEDAYNRRGSYLTEQGSAVSELAMDDEGFVLITEEGDTLWMNTDTLRLARVTEGEGWINGFDGSDSDYEYAMRIIRFRNPRYAIPVSSPLYWDVVYGGALWPSWDWNIYDDGLYAYVFPTTSNWHYWDYMMSYPFGWSAWGNHWSLHYGYHWGHHAGWQFYGHVWYDPWFNPYFHGYNPGWYHGPHHTPHWSHYPHHGIGAPGWSGPKAHANHRTPGSASGRSSAQTGRVEGRATAGSSRTSVSSNRASSSSSVRVVTGSSSRPSSSSVRSSGSNRVDNEEVVRRSTGSSSVNRSSSSSSSSRNGYTSRISSGSSSSSSYSRSSGVRNSSSSSISRSSSSSSSSSYSSGGSSRSSYSGGSSYNSGSSHSSYSSGSSHSSYSGGSRSGGSYGGGGSSRSSSGSRR